VRQPNGRLARWSDIVDNFTEADMTPGKCVDLAMEHGMQLMDAARKVQRAINDEPNLFSGGKRSGDGLDRWRECLRTVRDVHGDAAEREAERLCVSQAPKHLDRR